jgi:hypothetical protein
MCPVAKKMTTAELHRESCAVNVQRRRLAPDPHEESITLHLALIEWRGGSRRPCICLASASPPYQKLNDAFQSLQPRPFDTLFEITAAAPQLLDRNPSSGALDLTLGCVARLEATRATPPNNH